MTRSVAAIVPLFEGERHIEEALRSVLAQTRPADEVVVVDDGSRDGGPERVRRLARLHPAIRLVRQENAGQSAARNLGVRSTTADLVAFLDQDDTWHPDHLARLWEPFEAATGGAPLGWAYSDLDVADGSGAVRTRSLLALTAAPHPKTSLAGCLAHDMHVLPSASLVGREAFEAVGGFDERLAGYEDDDLFLRLFLAGYRNVFVPEALSTWRKHEGSASFSPRMARSRQVYVDKLAGLLADREGGSALMRDVVAPRFFRNLLVRYALALRDGDRAEMGQAAADLARLRTHLPGRLLGPALALRAGMALTASPGGAAIAGRLARPVVNRLGRRHALVAPSRATE